MVSCVIINVVCFSTPLLPILTRRFAVAEQDSTEVNREGTVVTLICFAVPRPVPLVDIALLNTATVGTAMVDTTMADSIRIDIAMVDTTMADTAMVDAHFVRDEDG